MIRLGERDADMVDQVLNEVAVPDAAFLGGGGKLGVLIRAKDWTATPLGPPEAWSRAAKT